MRVLFVGDLAPTGFGTVTLGLGKELLGLGHDVRFLSQNDWETVPEGWASRVVSAQAFNQMVNVLTLEGGAVPELDVLGALVRGTSQVNLESGEPWGGWRPEVVLLLGDYTATRALVALSPDAFDEIPTFHYCPIEGVDLPPAWALMWEHVHPVAMSRFGAEQIAKVVGHEVPMVYHGVDTALYRPVSGADPISWTTDNGTTALRSREECKRMWANWFSQGKDVTLPGLWAGRTDRHMPRKQYNILLRAMFGVLVRQPQIGLVLHCRPYDQGGTLTDTISKMPGAVNLLGDPDSDKPQPIGYAILGRPYPQILIPNTGPLVSEALRSFYCGLDLYVSNSSEGFGLTIAEALACGTPALALDFSSVPEVVGPAGRLAPVAGLIDNEYDHLWAVADVAEFGKLAEYLLTHKGKREELGRRGPGHIASSFRWRAAAEQFGALFEASR